MGHGHHHHGHELPFRPDDVPAVLDTSVPDSELSPDEVSRRGFLRGAGLLGAGAAAGGVFAGAGAAAADAGSRWSVAEGGDGGHRDDDRTRPGIFFNLTATTEIYTQ